ncbi:MAG TPA: hypothetical protein VFE39_11305 [Pseudonocardia sp.]|nr:hypothetical protein [Pseudonocardia sp.]
MLTGADNEHPWRATIPSSRFGQRPSEPVEYQRVTPKTVVELDVDASFDDHRWRHAARFVRLPASTIRPSEVLGSGSDASARRIRSGSTRP